MHSRDQRLLDRIATMNVLGSALGILTLLSHVCAYGSLARRFSQQLLAGTAMIAVYGGIGLICYALELYVLGWLNLWTPNAVLTSFFLSVLVLSAQSHLLKNIFRTNFTKRQKSIEAKLATGLVACMAIAITAGAFGEAKFEDERGYHWAAPQQWASAGHWRELPMRYMNSACLTELTYLSSSLVGTDISARWTHSCCFLLLICGAVTLGGFLNCPGYVTALAVLAAPVFVNQSASAMSDDALCCLLAATLIPLIDEYNSLSRGQRASAQIMSSVLLAGASSIKPVLAFAAVPSIIIFARHQNWPTRSVFLSSAGVCLATSLLWCFHTFLLTGAPFDANGIHILPPSQSLKDHLEAVGKIPAFIDILMLPIVPAMASVLGQNEPFGSRIGLLIVPFSLLLVFVIKNADEEQRRRIYSVAQAAAAYFVFVGLFTVRTRYLDFAWLLGLCLAAASYTLCQANQSKNIRIASTVLFIAGTLVGMVDGAHVVLNFHPTGQPTVKFLSTTRASGPLADKQ